MFIIGVSSEVKNKHCKWKQILTQIIKQVVRTHWVLSLDSCLSVSFLCLSPELSSLPTQPFLLHSCVFWDAFTCVSGCAGQNQAYLRSWGSCHIGSPTHGRISRRSAMTTWFGCGHRLCLGLLSRLAPPSAPRKPCSPWQQRGFCCSLSNDNNNINSSNYNNIIAHTCKVPGVGLYILNLTYLVLTMPWHRTFISLIWKMRKLRHR